jgi:hypothetical protein
MVVIDRSSSRLNSDSGGGLDLLHFAAPISSNASLYQAAFSNSAKFFFSLASHAVVKVPVSGSHLHESISAIMVGQHDRWNNSIRKLLGRP